MKTLPSLDHAIIKRTFSRDYLLEVLPFGPEAIFVNFVDVFEAGAPVHARGRLRVTEDHCRGHFLNHPILPGHIMIEVASQVAGAILLAQCEVGTDTSRYRGLFTGARHVKIRGQVPPDEILYMDVVITGKIDITRGETATMISCTAQGYANEQLVFQSKGHNLLVTPMLTRAPETTAANG